MTRVLELAFRAGRVSERHSTYYRGIPDVAQDGKPSVGGQGASEPRKEWTKYVQELLANDPEIKTSAIAEALEAKWLIDWKGKSYRMADTISFPKADDRNMSRKGFQNAITKHRKIARKKV